MLVHSKLLSKIIWVNSLMPSVIASALIYAASASVPLAKTALDGGLLSEFGFIVFWLCAQALPDEHHELPLQLLHCHRGSCALL